MSDPVYSENVKSQSEPFAAHRRAAIFQSKELLRVVEKIDHLINFSNLLLLVTGDKGAGKTTVLEHIAQASREELNLCQIVASKHLSVRDIIAQLAKQFQLKVDDQKSLESIPDMMESLDDSISLHRRVLLIDAADQLLPEVLSYLGQLNLAQKNLPEPELSIVLFADSSLNNVVTETVFEDLGSDGIHRIELKGLRSDEIEPFIDTICKHSDIGKSPFNSEQVKSIIAESRGNPLKVKQTAGALFKVIGPAALSGGYDDYMESDMDSGLNLGALDDDIDIDVELDNLDELDSLDDLDNDGPLLSELEDVPEISDDLLLDDHQIDKKNQQLNEASNLGESLVADSSLDDDLLVDVGLLDDDVDIDDEIDIDEDILEAEEEDIDPPISDLNPELDDYEDAEAPPLDLSVGDEDLGPSENSLPSVNTQPTPVSETDQSESTPQQTSKIDIGHDTPSEEATVTETIPAVNEQTASEALAKGGVSPFMDEPPVKDSFLDDHLVPMGKKKSSLGSKLISLLSIVGVLVIGGAAYKFFVMDAKAPTREVAKPAAKNSGEEELSMISHEELGRKPDNEQKTGTVDSAPASAPASAAAANDDQSDSNALGNETTTAAESEVKTSPKVNQPIQQAETPKQVAKNEVTQEPKPSKSEEAAKLETSQTVPGPKVSDSEPPKVSAPEPKSSEAASQTTGVSQADKSKVVVADPVAKKPVVTKSESPKPAPKPKPKETAVKNSTQGGLMTDADLNSAGGKGVTLQLAGFSRESGAQDFVKKYPNVSQIRYYERQLRGKPYFVVVHGFYTSRAEAITAKDNLPDPLRKLKPWIKPLSSVKKERESAQ